MTLFSAIALLFLVLDPLGNIPVFACVLNTVERERHTRIIIRELFIALGILVLSLFLGRHVLVLLGVSQPSLGIAGGIILLMIAIKMVFSGAGRLFRGCATQDPFIVPLAVPLMAGPSAIATVILLMGKDPQRWHLWLLAVCSAWLMSGILLFFSSRLCRLLGDKLLLAMERLMGMLLTAISVEMLVTGIRQSFFL